MPGSPEQKQGRAAVIGLGAVGVAAVKNLLEGGFDVTGFDQNDYIGGLWQWTANPNLTSVLKSTRANISKHVNCYQDFPFSDDVPTYPPADDIAKYIEAYAGHFGLHERFRLGSKIERLERSTDGTQWTLRFRDGEAKQHVEHFDKVVVTTGPYHTGFTPTVEGAKDFQGQLIHARSYKSNQNFAGKRVVVVGLSNTGGDIAVDLQSAASEVYLSFRAGCRVIGRTPHGQVPAEAKITRRLVKIGHAVNNAIPWLTSKLGAVFIERRMLKENPFIKPEWKLLPAGPIVNSTPVANDFILRSFANGKVTPKLGIKRLASPRTVEFADGTSIEDVDALIFATGYQADYSILAPEADPTAFPTPEWDRATHSNGLRYPRLYQGMLSTKYPTSLAFIGPFRGHSFAIFNNADLSSTAVAQVFAGNYNLPPQAEIEAWCDQNYAMNLKNIGKWRIAKVACNPKALEYWLNEAAGNDINQKLGWGWEGWSFFLRHNALYRMLIDGVDSPFIYRLFKGRDTPAGRKQWDGAHDAIKKLNRDIKQIGKK